MPRVDTTILNFHIFFIERFKNPSLLSNSNGITGTSDNNGMLGIRGVFDKSFLKKNDKVYWHNIRKIFLNFYNEYYPKNEKTYPPFISLIRQNTYRLI